MGYLLFFPVELAQCWSRRSQAGFFCFQLCMCTLRIFALERPLGPCLACAWCLFRMPVPGVCLGAWPFPPFVFLAAWFFGCRWRGGRKRVQRHKRTYCPNECFFGRGLIFLQRLFLGSFFLLSKVSEGR